MTLTSENWQDYDYSLLTTIEQIKEAVNTLDDITTDIANQIQAAKIKSEQGIDININWYQSALEAHKHARRKRKDLRDAFESLNREANGGSYQNKVIKLLEKIVLLMEKP
jgi:hypothetical protein